ncbi:MAG: SIMPL domain-containing protein [Clostridia bacterium]|nr:SIMPL domain-containing protein [Clostridia bacterium]
MDIIVEGNGVKYFKPDQITINFDFKTVEKTYDQALENGAINVEKYLNLLISLGFKKEDLKTRSFRVSEERHYDESKRIYVADGFAYSQSAKLTFDYDMERMSTLMEETSKFKNAPIYRISFNIKDNKQAQEELLALAYEDALLQANALAKASGTKVVTCKTVSFQPFDAERGYSSSMYDGAIMSKAKCCSDNARQAIQNVFIPEDVEVDMTIYCQFIAE